MSDPTPPPEQWRPLFDKIGVEFGYRPLATRLGMNHTRLRRLLIGGGTTDDAIRDVAHVFGVSAAKVRELRGEEPISRKPFTLPDDAGRLNNSERDVIRAMVRALLAARELGDGLEVTTEPDAPSEAPDQKTDAGNPRDNVRPLIQPNQVPGRKAARTRDPRVPPQDPDAT